MQQRVIVIKIGGSTLGKHDTTLEDLVSLQNQGVPVVLVHGGGQTASAWLTRLGISTSFINGLRVTDARSLKVVTAIFAGLVNKELVSALQALGGKTMGLSGCDGNMLRADIKNPELGYVGQISKVNPAPLKLLLDAGYMPVVAPISTGSRDGKATLLNINGDAAAGEIAATLGAGSLIFLTDVDGIHDDSGKTLAKISATEAASMLGSGTISGGMIPKIKACLKALTTVPTTRIINGTVSHALLNEMKNATGGTTIAAE